ncbi:hypothetical protein C8R44DRAFT_742752 [Mycena epipterygia]|nr:hypothetical protein C8R44DRAFT_742752 [Mycena epipterygia]
MTMERMRWAECVRQRVGARERGNAESHQWRLREEKEEYKNGSEYRAEFSLGDAPNQLGVAKKISPRSKKRKPFGIHSPTIAVAILLAATPTLVRLIRITAPTSPLPRAPTETLGTHSTPVQFRMKGESVPTPSGRLYTREKPDFSLKLEASRISKESEALQSWALNEGVRIGWMSPKVSESPDDMDVGSRESGPLGPFFDVHELSRRTILMPVSPSLSYVGPGFLRAIGVNLVVLSLRLDVSAVADARSLILHKTLYVHGLRGHPPPPDPKSQVHRAREHYDTSPPPYGSLIDGFVFGAVPLLPPSRSDIAPGTSTQFSMS